MGSRNSRDFVDSVNRANMASTIPVGQEAKYFGVYMVLQKSLTWAPQLLYAFLNQVGLRVLAVTGIIPFFLLGLGGFFILDVTAIAKERQLLEKTLEKSIAVA